jgi:hypothetical protein
VPNSSAAYLISYALTKAAGGADRRIANMMQNPAKAPQLQQQLGLGANTSRLGIRNAIDQRAQQQVANSGSNKRINAALENPNASAGLDTFNTKRLKQQQDTSPRALAVAQNNPSGPADDARDHFPANRVARLTPNPQPMAAFVARDTGNEAREYTFGGGHEMTSAGSTEAPTRLMRGYTGTGPASFATAKSNAAVAADYATRKGYTGGLTRPTIGEYKLNKPAYMPHQIAAMDPAKLQQVTQQLNSGDAALFGPHIGTTDQQLRVDKIRANFARPLSPKPMDRATMVDPNNLANYETVLPSRDLQPQQASAFYTPQRSQSNPKDFEMRQLGHQRNGNWTPATGQTLFPQADQNAYNQGVAGFKAQIPVKTAMACCHYLLKRALDSASASKDGPGALSIMLHAFLGGVHGAYEGGIHGLSHGPVSGLAGAAGGAALGATMGGVTTAYGH